MKSKKLICAAVAATIALSATLSGCTLVSTLNDEDMRQVIATVDISASENLKDEQLENASAIGKTEIIKRDLIAAYLNVGYSYVQNGSSYSEVFTSLVNSLTSNAVITQYATLYLLNQPAYSSAVEVFNDESKTEVEKYEALLTLVDNDTDETTEGNNVLLAQYGFLSGINSSLDSIEESIIDGDDKTSGSDTRSTPSGVDTEVEDYLPLTANGELDYNVYTGYGEYLLDNSGVYKEDALEGTTKNTRRKAYSRFISTLKSNYLIAESDDTTDVLKIAYMNDEYLSRLQQQVINVYYDLFTKQQEDMIQQTENGVYTFVQSKYEDMYRNQTISNSSVSSFESAMGSISDSSFLLYAPQTDGTEGGTYGYVYNILLPFNSAQSVEIESGSTSVDYYLKRKGLLAEITTTDQRSAWFNGATDYSFDASESSVTDYYGKTSGRNYLFFKNNLTDNTKYEELDKYIGLYSYNGTVSENKDGSYSLVPNKLDIDGMLDEFVAYINYVLGYDAASAPAKNAAYNVASADDYYTDETVDLTDDSKKEIDYSRFVYATGSVNLQGQDGKRDMFDKSSNRYKAMAAVNELQYAYTTDTGVLSQYIGYSVSAYDTSYIKEFEYAAKEAVANGVGSYTVCAGDYGWHLIYVTDTFATEGGEVYAGAVWTKERIETEGTFENLFYNWLKDSVLSNATSGRRSYIIERFGGDVTVTLYQNTYQDLLDLDNN